jgi:hypothetical protein
MTTSQNPCFRNRWRARTLLRRGPAREAERIEIEDLEIDLCVTESPEEEYASTCRPGSSHCSTSSRDDTAKSLVARKSPHTFGI